MSISIQLLPHHIDQLDLSPVRLVVESWPNPSDSTLDPIQFEIHYPQDENDSVELPDIPEVRLWFIQLDAVYPWLPYVLDWRSGELARYAAMLVPHQFSDREGIQYNPQALDIFVMSKLFIVSHWLKQHGTQGHQKLKQMAEMFGYEIESDFFQLLDSQP